MVLVVDDDASPERRLNNKRALGNCEYSYADFAIKCNRSRVFAIRDFPDGCGRRSDKAVVLSVHSYENLADNEKGVVALDSVIESCRTVEKVLEDVDLLELVDASDDFALKMVHMVSSADGGEEEDLAELVDDEGVVAVEPLVALLDHEASSALSKEAIVRSYPLPRIGISANRGFPITFGSNTRRISARRDFPLGCRDDNPLADSQETYPKSTGFDVLDHKFANVDGKSFEEVVKSDMKQVKEVSEESRYRILAQSGLDATRIKTLKEDTKGMSVKSPCDTNLPQTSTKVIQKHRRLESSEATMEKNLMINIKNSTSQVQRGSPTLWQVNRVAVQALMAATECPSRQSGIKRVKELSEESVYQVRAQAGVDGTRLLKPSQTTNCIGESIKAPFDINLSQSSPKLIKKHRRNKGGSDGTMVKNLLNNTKNSMNQVQRENPSYSQASRVTVQALIAAKNCS